MRLRALKVVMKSRRRRALEERRRTKVRSTEAVSTCYHQIHNPNLAYYSGIVYVNICIGVSCYVKVTEMWCYRPCSLCHLGVQFRIFIFLHVHTHSEPFLFTQNLHMHVCRTFSNVLHHSVSCHVFSCRYMKSWWQ